ncbi:MAG TPA: VOC family protein [Candidatus Limnocylindria bacterium]|nr:VOC family protein [Candidatus Limnocylindria bacterium]
MAIPPRVSLVTLGVKDVSRSTLFYVALGWPLSSASVAGEVSFFKTAGGLLALWSEEALAADAGVDATPGAGHLSALAINLDSREQVDSALATAAAAGAKILVPGRETDWGGYNGYFADPDGHLWEVAHNPFWPIGQDGRPLLPD